MLTGLIGRIVAASARFAWLVLLAGLVVTVIAGTWAAQHFAINTNTDDLISDSLDWRQRQITFDKAFPALHERIIAVLDAPTPELADRAAAELAGKLAVQTDKFIAVERPDALPFFRRNAFLFLPQDEVERNLRGIQDAQALLATLAADPSLRGLAGAIDQFGSGVEMGMAQFDDIAPVLTSVAEATEKTLTGQNPVFSWRPVLGGPAPTAGDLRRFILIRPKLDYAALEPGAAASTEVRGAAKTLGLTPDAGYRLRLTGDVPLADEEFATVADGALLTNLGTIAIVAFLLWAALRSGRIVLAILVSVIVGLVVTAALGLAMVGALNLISVAFAVLFVGIGADFGIQFSVRYRAERHAVGGLDEALQRAGVLAGKPLALAAAGTACGFLAFLPTVYRGVSELGLIAGCGMIVAFATSITILPACLKLLRPPAEADEVGYAFLAPADLFLARHRYWIIFGTLGLVLAGTPLLRDLHFDFNPLNLRSNAVESVATLKDLMKDPATNYNTADVLAPDAAAAAALADRLAALPEVERAVTLTSFVPADQAQRLAAIHAAAAAILPDFERPRLPPPDDAENMAALAKATSTLREAAGAAPGAGADAARRLADAFDKLMAANTGARHALTTTLIVPLEITIAGVREILQAEPVTLASLPDALRRNWQTPDGRTRIEASPRGNPNDNDTIHRFTEAVKRVAPEATGAPVAIQGAGDTIVRAFVEAGAWALISISILLYIVLRRIADVLLTLVPLMLAGLVTLEICVLIDLPLNFANIIALPLLLGLGVAFKIYFVMAWRAGVTGLLQSSLTRAVFFSALTTATAFGSLWLSNHPGTSSMGKLLALSLVCTLAAAVLFQPALMGPPRQRVGEEVR